MRGRRGLGLIGDGGVGCVRGGRRIVGESTVLGDYVRMVGRVCVYGVYT